MDNRRTPNNSQQNKGSNSRSASKFAAPRPRSFRRQDANSTVLLGSHNDHNMSVMGSGRNLNHTVRYNLDTTISGSSNPRIKSSIGASTPDVDLEYDLAYNDYLQALMKQQIVKKTVSQHKEKLDDQILFQTQHLNKFKSTLMGITSEIENLKVQSEIVETINVLENGMNELLNLCEKYNTNNRLQQINSILTEESNLVSTRNIKPINSQEEYDELISTLKSLSVVLEKIQNSHINLEEVNNLAAKIKSFNELRNTVEQAAKQIGDLKKKSAAELINSASDMFAECGGYF